MIIIIVIIVIVILLTMLFRYMLIKNIFINENKRMLAMNGINCQYYITFAHHFNLFNLFKKLITILNDNNIDYIITCGTLLGYCRHNNGFIPWDDDIDICVFEKDLEKLKSIMYHIVKEKKYSFKNSPYGKNTFYQFSSNLINMKTLVSNIFIDIFIINNNINDNKYKYYDTLDKYFPNEYYMKDELYPLQNGYFTLYAPDGTIYEKILIKLPNKPIEYLTRTYTDWKIKKVYSPHSIYNMFLFNKLIPYEYLKIIANNFVEKNYTNIKIDNYLY